MSGPALSVREDWDALRRRFAGEALAGVLAFCGWRAEAGEQAEGGPGDRGDEGIAPCGSLLLRTEDGTRQLWQGVPLTGAPPDWPREVPEDAARFFLTARPLGEPAALDSDLAARRDGANPFYVTCYTERRLRALLSRREPEGRSVPAPFSGEARALALEISRFPAAVRRAAEMLDPFPVNRCALALALAARDFLRAGGRDRPLLAAAETALGNALGLLGVGGDRIPPPSLCSGTPL